ncbi:CoA-transferase subunit beta [Streptomyces sp. bgisy100]|uniref:CoA-transferase subunit beta n=1 Tax=Streptomyces sp. bgisy100 TaxID=3413783 RepID=UPI003D73E80E
MTSGPANSMTAGSIPADSEPAVSGRAVSGRAAATRAEYCVVACAEAWRGAGEILASPMGTVPTIAARLARLTFAPDLLLTDGEALLIGDVPELGGTARVVEGWLPFHRHLAMAAGGRRHVMMGASQLDRHGNQNIACIGDWERPDRQLLGVRGAPVNTLNHATSYWVPRHSRRVFVERVDMVCGVGYDRAAAAGPSATRFHRLPRVVSDLGVFDFETPDRSMRLVSVHPGVTVDDVVAATGFPLAVASGAADPSRAENSSGAAHSSEAADPSGQGDPAEPGAPSGQADVQESASVQESAAAQGSTAPTGVPFTREPTAEELRLIREVLDPRGLRDREVRS